jgi:hypothetical protein
LLHCAALSIFDQYATPSFPSAFCAINLRCSPFRTAKPIIGGGRTHTWLPIALITPSINMLGYVHVCAERKLMQFEKGGTSLILSPSFSLIGLAYLINFALAGGLV